MSKVNLIVAISENNVIGKENKLPWQIKEDLKYFKDKTRDGVVIMGRNTFESVGSKPLKDRINIVISSKSPDLFPSDVTVVDNIEDAVSIAKEYGKDVWFIGGVGIYKTSIDKGLVDQMYITRVHNEYDGDTFFPEVNWDGWEIINENSLSSSTGTEISFQVWNKT